MGYIKVWKNKLNSLLPYGNKKLNKLIFDTITNITYNLNMPHAEYLSWDWFQTVFNNELAKLINMEEKHFEIIWILLKLTKKNKALEWYEEWITTKINSRDNEKSL